MPKEPATPRTESHDDCVFSHPLVVAAADDAPRPVARAHSSGRRATRVLLVEDQADNLELLAAALERRGYSVVTAANGVDAVGALEDHVPDVAVVDLGLPDISGLEVARRARELEDGRQLRLVALTGHSGQKDRQEVMDAGFDEHLVKPVSVRVLCSVIDGNPDQSTF